MAETGSCWWNPLFLRSDFELQAPQHGTLWAEHLHMPVPNVLRMNCFRTIGSPTRRFHRQIYLGHLAIAEIPDMGDLNRALSARSW